MPAITTRFGNISWFLFREWFDLNVKDLAYIALVLGTVFIIGVLVT